MVAVWYGLLWGGRVLDIFGEGEEVDRERYLNNIQRNHRHAAYI
jgi:hypothetical protein